MQYRKIFLIIVFLLTACADNNDLDPYVAYENGNFEIARQQLLPLVEADDPKAQTYLGAIYQIERDYAEAVKHYTAAARQNYAPAQYNLGLMLHAGTGTEKSLFQAYGWFDLAMRQGHSKAQNQIRIMSGELTPNQSMKARDWAKEQIIKH